MRGLMASHRALLCRDGRERQWGSWNIEVRVEISQKDNPWKERKFHSRLFLGPGDWERRVSRATPGDTEGSFQRPLSWTSECLRGRRSLQQGQGPSTYTIPFSLATVRDRGKVSNKLETIKLHRANSFKDIAQAVQVQIQSEHFLMRGRNRKSKGREILLGVTGFFPEGTPGLTWQGTSHMDPLLMLPKQYPTPPSFAHLLPAGCGVESSELRVQ